MRIKEISSELIGKETTIIGWVKKIRKLGELVFIDLVDKDGLIQLKFDLNSNSKFKQSFANQEIGIQFLIEAHGNLIKRKDPNKDIKNGDLELEVKEITIVSTSKNPPFVIEEAENALEKTRMEYRFLDLRRPNIGSILSFRSHFYRIVRNYLYELDFNEIETPYITSPTSGGSKELEVHSSNFEDKYYALAQSPQVYKQLLMIGGMDRYFQIAKCFRDEKSRSDRQIEFSQLDLEMSFVKENDVQGLIENLLKKLFKELLNQELKTPFKHMTFKEAMSKYGSDKPDVSFDHLIEQINNLETSFEHPFLDSLISNHFLFMLKLPINISTNRLKKISADAKVENQIVFWIQNSNNQITSSLNPYSKKLGDLISLENNQVAFFSFTKIEEPTFLGRLRVELAKEFLLINKNNQQSFNFLWIENFPMFTIEDDKITSSHNPFTSPIDDSFFQQNDVDIIKNYFSRSYDLVLNGSEVGGGSIRIKDPSNQRFIFEKLGYSNEEIEKYFGFFLEALSYGTPPHGGIALGIDRLIAIMLDKESIREVIAFPKTSKATDELTKGPFSKN